MEYPGTGPRRLYSSLAIEVRALMSHLGWKGLLMIHVGSLERLAVDHEGFAVVAALAGAGLVCFGFVRLWRAVSRSSVTPERAVTLLGSTIASAVAAQGMWVFFQGLHAPVWLTPVVFAFLEVMVLGCAMRARQAQLETGDAGIDRIGMWAFTILSGVLAATHADSIGTFLIRVAAPIVAAWGWERSMALESRRAGVEKRIHWRISPERVLIRLGLADPTDRTATDIAAQRRLIAVALAADDARTARNTQARDSNGKDLQKAIRRLRKTVRRAIEDGWLVNSDGRSRGDVLLEHISMLYAVDALLDVQPANLWGRHPDSMEGASEDRETRDRELIRLMASASAEANVVSVLSPVGGGESSAEVPVDAAAGTEQSRLGSADGSEAIESLTAISGRVPSVGPEFEARVEAELTPTPETDARAASASADWDVVAARIDGPGRDTDQTAEILRRVYVMNQDPWQVAAAIGCQPAKVERILHDAEPYVMAMGG